MAFSGEVDAPEVIPESGDHSFRETSASLNPNLKVRDIAKAFDTDEYQILLVANKFQTGFDQPLLCGMYVDKRLSGIAAVQTLSRLNRSYRGAYGVKDTTYIVDFVNGPGEILESFKVYYETAALSDVTDPNLVFDLRTKLDSVALYDDFEVNRVVQVAINPKSKQSELDAALSPVASCILKRYNIAKEKLQCATEANDAGAIAD